MPKKIPLALRPLGKDGELVMKATELFESTKYEEALSILRDVQKSPSTDAGLKLATKNLLAPVIEKVAEKYRSEGNLEKSLSLYNELLTMRPFVTEKDNLRVKRAIGLILREQGRYQESYDILTVALLREKKLFGTEDMYGQHTLAKALSSLERFEESISLYRTVLAKGIRALDKDDQFIMWAQNDLALLLLRTRNFEDALKLFQEYLEKKKRTSKSDDLMAQSDILRTKNNIATVLLELGRHQEVLTILMEIMGTDENQFATAHINAVETFARYYYEREKFEQCLHAYRWVIEKKKELFGSVNLDILTTQYNMAEILKEMGECEEAIQVFREVQAGRKLIPGLDYRESLIIQDNIGQMLLALDKLEEAWHFLDRELTRRTDKFGLNSPYTMTTQYWIGCVSFEMGKFSRAAQLFEKVYTGRRAVLGDQHPETQDAKEGLDLAIIHYTNSGEQEQEKIDELKRAKLHRAIKSGSVAAVSQLLSDGIPIEQVTANKGNTSLHVAALKGDNKIVKLLLDYAKQRLNPRELNAFLNAQTNSDKDTALHLAAKQGSLNVAKSLLIYGAIYSSKNNGGKTPADLAVASVLVLFKLIDELFQNTGAGESETLVMKTIRGLADEEFLAVANARNSQGHTLLLNAMRNKQKTIVDEISKLLREKSANRQ